MDYIQTNFGVDSSSRFPFKARTHRQHGTHSHRRDWSAYPRLGWRRHEWQVVSHRCRWNDMLHADSNFSRFRWLGDSVDHDQRPRQPMTSYLRPVVIVCFPFVFEISTSYVFGFRYDLAISDWTIRLLWHGTDRQTDKQTDTGFA